VGGWVIGLVFSHDEGLIYVATEKHVSAYNVRDLAPQGRLESNESGHGYSAISISPNGKLIAAGTYKGDVVLWDSSTAKKTMMISSGGMFVRSIAFSPSSDKVMFAYHDRDKDKVAAFGAIDLRTRLVSRLVMEDLDSVSALRFSPDGTMLGVVGDNGLVKVLQPNALAGRMITSNGD
jgi:WD40 repeat protein